MLPNGSPMLADFDLGSLLTINLIFASLALVIGFFAGVWFFGPSATRKTVPSDEPEDHSKAEMQRTAERAIMALQRIQDLAKGMASDVGAHASEVEAITADLQQMAEENPNDAIDMIAAVNRIVKANDQLQDRLAMAEHQIEAQAAELRTYETQARTDSLTGLANRRAFDDELGRRFAEWQRRRTPFSLLILDIDHFKKFNDSHGHSAGDEVLRNVGQVLVKTARQMDLPCRYGGEEFAVILPATDIEEGRVAADRFRRAIEATHATFDGKKLSVTASIGMARVNDQDDPAWLIRRADEALYKSKQAGRNCGYWHDGQHSQPVVTPKEKAADPTQAKQQSPQSLVDQLPNRSQFVDLLKSRVNESHRFGIPLSVMHLRVNDFHTMSREYGKSIALMALESVAQCAQAALREMDYLARLEDGDFVALLPGSTLSEAGQVARRLHNSVATCSRPHIKGKIQLQLTHGLAQLQPNETAIGLMARAKEENDSAGASCPLAAS
jgi:diguanylate cyclase